MSVKISTWAWKQPLKNGPKLALMALADESNDQGMVFMSREKIAMKVAGLDSDASDEEKDNATRTLRRNINFLIEQDLVRAGRRQRQWTRGRAVDVLFLNVRGVEGVTLYDSLDDVPGELPNPYLMVSDDSEPSNVLPDKLSGKKVSPSQDLPDKLSGKSEKDVFTGQNVSSYRTNLVVLPDNFVVKNESALIGTRARFNPLSNPSINPSVSEAPHVEEMTDGRSEEVFDPWAEDVWATVATANNQSRKTTTPAPIQAPTAEAETEQEPEDLTHIVKGVNLHKLREALGEKAKLLDDATLGLMWSTVAERAQGRIKYPMRLAVTSIEKEFYELLSLALDELNVDGLAQSDEPASAAVSWDTCPIHDVQFRSGGVCTSCAGDKKSAVVAEDSEESLPVLLGEDGKPLTGPAYLRAYKNQVLAS